MTEVFDFSGTWHCVYQYTSSVKPGTFESTYDVTLQSVGNQLIIQSTPNDFGDYILIRMTQDSRILTGTWYEQTSPKGEFKGVAYYGAIQLVISEDGNKMIGKSVGFGRNFEVRVREWEITRTK